MVDTGSGFLYDYLVILISVIIGATVLLLVYITSLSSKGEEAKNGAEAEVVKEKKQHKEGGSAGVSKSSKKKQHGTERWARDSKQSFSHPWLLTSLKGHSGQVLDMDFSSNGKYLATCAEDRAVLIWSTKDWNRREHKSLRINVEFDHASFVKWSPDCKAFILHKATEKVMEVFKLTKRSDGWISSVTKALTFPKHHEEDVVGIGIACNGRFMMSCSDKNELVIWDLKGELLAKLDTCLLSTTCACISPCGRFVVASGFAPDVKVWEVKFSKTNEFQHVARAFELTGHTSGVYDVAFNSASTRMATVSKDGTWKVFNTKIEFEKGEDPHLLITGKYNHASGSSHVHIAMSPNGEVVAVSSGSSLAFYSVLTGKCDCTIEDVYAGPINSLLFDSLGKYVLTGGEKHVRVFHNVTGYRETITTLKSKMNQSGVSSAQRERMDQLVKEAEEFLAGIETC